MKAKAKEIVRGLCAAFSVATIGGYGVLCAFGFNPVSPPKPETPPHRHGSSQEVPYVDSKDVPPLTPEREKYDLAQMQAQVTKAMNNDEARRHIVSVDVKNPVKFQEGDGPLGIYGVFNAVTKDPAEEYVVAYCGPSPTDKKQAAKGVIKCDVYVARGLSYEQLTGDVHTVPTPG